MRDVNVFHEMIAKKKQIQQATSQEKERNIDKTKFNRSNKSFVLTLGSLSNHDDDGNKNPPNLHI